MDLALLPLSIQNKFSVANLISSNDLTSKYGLSLSEKEAYELIEVRNNALETNNRIEFGGGIIDKIIKEFCDSPYLIQDNYFETIQSLVELFYYYKSECLDEISDNELISLMRKYFDENCHGCIELLQYRDLDELSHNIRFDIGNYADINGGSRQEYLEENIDNIFFKDE